MIPPRKKRISLVEEKSILLGGFSEIRSLVLEEAAQIKSGQGDQPFVGTWNILDLLAHLCGWDATILQSAIDILQGKLPEFYAQYDKDWISYNAGLVAK